MKKFICLLAISLSVSSLSAMSFPDDVIVITKEHSKFQVLQNEKFSFDADLFIASPTVLQDVPQIPFEKGNEIKVVELWSFILPKSTILKNQISVTHQKIFQNELPGESNILNFTKSILDHKILNTKYHDFKGKFSFCV